MNKRWTEQKYVIYFLLSVMVLGVCGSVSYGLACCQTKVSRDKEAGLVKAIGEADECYVPYRASEQRKIEIEMFAYGIGDGMGVQTAGQAEAARSADAGGNMHAIPQTGEEAELQAGGNAAIVLQADEGAGTEPSNEAGTAQEDEVQNVQDVAEGGAEAPGTQDAAEGRTEASGAQDIAEGGAEAPETQENAEGGAEAPETQGNAGRETEAPGTQDVAAAGTETSDVRDGTEVQTIGQAIAVSAEDYEALLRIVQAEAGNEDTKGKILVANVVLNRVADARFPDTVYEVVFQRSGGRAQFSPVASGSYYKVVVSDDTREAVDRALAGEDYSEGALFFAARRYAGSSQMRWFDECLTKLFSYGGHEFFTS